ncbi:MAG: IS110 family transposase, partial [Candidatus Aureabacteria bacterium]|nr:IS110 family transposase [Candidatus Auribacterota bacterium]
AWYCVFDAQGHRLSHGSLPASPESFKKFFEGLPRPFKMAVEATYNWYYVIDIAEKYAAEVYLADSYQVKAFAKKHKKTDKIDARLIAWLLHRGDLPTVAIPDKETRQKREVLRYRMRVVSDKTRNIVRLKALLDKLGLEGTGDFNTIKRRAEIGAMDIPAPYGEIVRSYLTRIEQLCTEVKTLDKSVATLAGKNEDVMRIMTVPGFDSFSALLVESEIFNINRFRSFPALCAYSGLAPRVHGSGGHYYHGPLNTNRRKHLQWILLENAWHSMRKIPRLEHKYAAIKKRKGSNTAKVAVARDVLKIIYHVLKEKRPFYREIPGNHTRVSYSQSTGAPALVGV